MDYPGTVKVERMDSPGTGIVGQRVSHLPLANSIRNAEEGRGGRISLDIAPEIFLGYGVEGEARMLDSSPACITLEDSKRTIEEVKNSLPDISLGTREDGEGGKNDPPLVNISSDDSAPSLLLGDTSSSSGVQVLSLLPAPL